MYEVSTEDIVYRTAGDLSLPARIYRPKGEGPFPAFVDLHGGAWIKGAYVNNDPINMRIARRGVVVMAAEYRMPPAGTYPSSVQDANFAVRWLKMNAERLGSRASDVGIMGTSAGGHLAVLAGIKPHDPRYAALPLPGEEHIDATVARIVCMWPVICPATRYQENLDRKARGDTSLAHREGAGFGQMAYWVDTENMADGSPVFSLERGDEVDLPDLLYVQAYCDTLHARHNMDRFCKAYLERGGYLETEMMDVEPYDALRNAPDVEASRRAFDHIARFAHGEKSRASTTETVG